MINKVDRVEKSVGTDVFDIGTAQIKITVLKSVKNDFLKLINLDLKARILNSNIENTKKHNFAKYVFSVSRTE